MATRTIYAAVPAVAAAIGFYFFDRNHIKDLGRGISASSQCMMVKVKEELKELRKPKLAPQLDGLHCFETLVGQ